MSMEQKRRVIPPVYFLCALVVMLALHYFLPLAQVIRSPYSWLGGLLIVGGILLSFWGSQLFARLGTPVIPFERSTVLVTSGPFRISRNPMYLGMVIILVGTALFMGTASPWLPIPVFVWIIHTHFVAGEERFLEEIFGAEYLDYKKSVRRWL